MSEELRVDVKERLEESLKRNLKHTWDQLEELWKLEVQEALEDLAQLTVLVFKGQDLADEVLHAEARVANWSFVGADLVRDALKQALEELLQLFGSLIKGFLK